MFIHEELAGCTPLSAEPCKQAQGRVSLHCFIRESQAQQHWELQLGHSPEPLAKGHSKMLRNGHLRTSPLQAKREHPSSSQSAASLLNLGNSADRRLKPSTGQTYFQSPVLWKNTENIVRESLNCLGWKRPVRSSSPTFNPALPRPSLNHVPRCHIYTFI